jgi:tRNA G10  N-methylase Trm11
LIKLGQVLREQATIEELQSDSFLQDLYRLLPPKGKVVFGVSAYGSPALIRAAKSLSQSIKTFLAENNRPGRFLVGERGALSSVVVEKEKLGTRGIELLCAAEKDRVVVARTIAVQPFEDFSHRDYGRPRRDARSGILPPKVARILVNLSGADTSSVLCDPFCGSGTILQEAALLGCTRVIGADISTKAVMETKENLAWLAAQHTQPMPAVAVFQSDIRELGARIPPESVDVIVTEPLLGPPLRGGEDISAIRRDLEELYERSFRVLFRILRSGSRVVFIFPVFFENEKPRFMMNLDACCAVGFRLLQTLPPSLAAYYQRSLSFRHTILYRRPGQRVGREILLFQKVE